MKILLLLLSFSQLVLAQDITTSFDFQPISVTSSTLLLLDKIDSLENLESSRNIMGLKVYIELDSTDKLITYNIDYIHNLANSVASAEVVKALGSKNETVLFYLAQSFNTLEKMTHDIELKHCLYKEKNKVNFIQLSEKKYLEYNFIDTPLIATIAIVDAIKNGLLINQYFILSCMSN